MVRGMFLREEATSWTCFETSELSNIFRLYLHCDILDNSSLKDIDEELESRETLDRQL